MEKQNKIIRPGEFMEAVPGAAQEPVQPHLFAIYDQKPDQIGTGFLTF